MTTSGRIQILPYPVVPPGKCILCGANHNRDGRKYLDFGMSLPQYGAVYWCTICMAEATKPLGFLTPAEARQLESDWEEMNLAVQRMQEENGKLRTALSELDFLRRDRASVYDDPNIDEPGTGDISESDNESGDVVELGADDKSGSTKSSNVSGFEDVHDLISKPVRLSDAL